MSARKALSKSGLSRCNRGRQIAPPLVELRTFPICPLLDWQYGCCESQRFQIEKRRSMVCTVEFVSDVLKDGRDDRFYRMVASKQFDEVKLFLFHVAEFRHFSLEFK